MVLTRLALGTTIGASVFIAWKIFSPNVSKVGEGIQPQIVSTPVPTYKRLHDVLSSKIDIEGLDALSLDDLCTLTFRNIEAAFQPIRKVTNLEVYTMFGAKTSYDDVRALTVDQVDIPGCEPVQVWILARHGTRYPGEAELLGLFENLPGIQNKILESASKGKGALTEDVLKDLRNWNFDIHPSHYNRLTPSGARESRELASRFKQRFPALFLEEYHPSIYVFRHTDSSRTKESAEQFAAGLFGVAVSLPQPLKADPVIKFYKSCKRWLEEVENNVSSRVHRERFRKGPEMTAVLADCRNRLGIDDLSIDDMLIIYSMCRFEHAFKNDITAQSGHCSPWCKLFTKKEIEILEYDEDLEYYWTDGYGFDINYEQACPPVKDFLDRFKLAMEKEGQEPKGIFHFSHSGLILKVYARLGLYKDSLPLTSEEFDAHKKRLWRSSLIDPFNANLAMVLFNCQGEFKVLTLSQEKPIILPGCSSQLCPMAEILETYGSVAEKCDIQTICEGLEYKRKKHKTKFGKIVKKTIE